MATDTQHHPAPPEGAEDITDAEVVHDHDETAAPGTTLAVVDPGVAGAVIRAEKPTEIIEKATEIANALKQMIEAQNLAKDLGGRRKHIEVGGWQALGAMLGALGGQPLHAETVWTRRVIGPDGEPTGNEHGSDWEACVEIRTPGGVVVGRAEAMCSRQESNWSRRDDYAVRSMAETRAESRAFRRAVGWIVSIAGYNPTPAEEMGHQPGHDAPAMGDVRPYGPPAEADLLAATRRAIAYLLGEDPHGQPVTDLMATIVAKADGYMPAIVARAVGVTAGHVKNRREGNADTPAAEGGQGTLGDQLDQPAASDDADVPAGETIPAPGSLAKAPRAVRVNTCTCPCGFEVADNPNDPAYAGADLDDDCPVHGVPFTT